MRRMRESAHVFLAGRQDEMRTLRRSLRATPGGTPDPVHITGELGIGRTALLRAFSATARAEGATTVELTCLSREFGPDSALPARWAGRVAALLPPGHPARARLEADAGAPDGPATTGARDVPERLLSGLRAALTALTGPAPLVVTLDDAHAADPASLRLLGRVLAAPLPVPPLLVASTAVGEADRSAGAVDALLAGARHIRLAGLPRGGTAALLRHTLRRTPPASAVAAWHRACAGNPFLLTEAAREVRGPSLAGPEQPGGGPRLAAVAEAVEARLQSLDPNAAKVAAVLAVVGTEQPPDPLLVSHLAGLSLPDTLAAADLLVRMRLVEDSDTLALRHRLVRDALLGRTTQMARNALHLEAAHFLRGKHAPVEHVAHHLTASSVPLDEQWQAPVLLRAGRAALEARDPERARRCLERALRVATGDERRTVLLHLTDAELRADLGAGLRRAVRRLEQTAEEQLRCCLVAHISSALYLRSQPGEAARGEASTVLSRSRPAGWARLHRILDSLQTCPPPSAARLGEEPLVPAGHGPAVLTASTVEVFGPDQVRAVTAVMSALHSHLSGQDTPAAVRHVREALRTEGGLCLAPFLMTMALMVLVWHGRDEEAAAHLRGHQECARCREHPLRRALLLPVTAYMALARGRLATARDELTECREALVGYGTRKQHPFLVWVVGMLADVLLTAGSDGEARALLREHGCLGSLPPGWLYSDVLLVRARSRADAGDLPGASKDLTAHLEGGVPSGPRGRAHAVSLLRQLGREDEATAVARALSRTARGLGARERGIALRVHGALHRGLRGEEALREAVRLLSDNADLDLAHACADLASLLFEQGGDDEALRHLSTALGLAERCGARPFAARLRQRLAVAEGRTAGRSALGGVLLLTGREKQILIDAARGLTNERIATTLYITRRTVELHLSSAYRKLGITGRKDFPGLFRTAGLWQLLLDTSQHGAAGRAASVPR